MLVRYAGAFSLLAIAILSVLSVVRELPKQPPAVEFLGIAAPRTIVSGDNYALFAGLKVPMGNYGVGVWLCSHHGCRRRSWLLVDGPSMTWQWLATVHLPKGAGKIVIRAYDTGRMWVGPAVKWSTNVSIK